MAMARDTSIVTRRATSSDLPAILALARRSLGWTDDDERFLSWKHLENPFGASPMWLALDGARVVGFRAFLRWEFTRPDGAVVPAVRAVDTATDPDYQGRGIFTRLTLEAIDALGAEGIQLVFNTPNARSLPGYLKMGWREVGRLPVGVMPTHLRFPLVVLSARQGAGRTALPARGGLPAPEVLADSVAVDDLLARRSARGGLSTRLTAARLAWRYGPTDLGYRVILAAPEQGPREGLAIFRLRRRGKATEGVLCEVLAPAGDPRVGVGLARRVARVAGADYLIRIERRSITSEPFVRVPRTGPMLTCRTLDGSDTPPLDAWALTMGDVELF
jgi:GNAT superfamily N-acetyltransferase